MSRDVSLRHELLAVSAETAQEELEERPDSLKGYDLGLLPGNKEEQQQLSDLLEHSASALNRLMFRKIDLGDTSRRISGDVTTASDVGDSYDRLGESYLFTRNTDLPRESEGRLRSMQDQSIAQLLRDLHLSVPIFVFDRMQDSRQGGNDDQISETLSRLSFGAGVGERASGQYPSAENGRGTSSAVRTVLSHWELGSDPSTYVPPAMFDTHDLSLDKASTQLPIAATADTPPRTVKLPRFNSTLTSAPPIRMDAAPPSPSAGASLPTYKNQSQVQFEPETQSQSQEFASTQIEPGPFGNRTALSFRRSLGGKKRTIGF